LGLSLSAGKVPNGPVVYADATWSERGKIMQEWTREAVLARARDRGLFFVSQAASTARLRGLCTQLVREGLLAAAGRRGTALAYYPAPNLPTRNVGAAKAP
jgi:hypothetical protein